MYKKENTDRTADKSHAFWKQWQHSSCLLTPEDTNL